MLEVKVTRKSVYDFSSFSPDEYIQEYYSHIGPENTRLLNFFHSSYTHIFSLIPRARVAEFGGGPTIYQLISLARYPVSIDFYEYVQANRDEVKSWLANQPGKFNWRRFIQYVLRLEKASVSSRSVQHREQLLRTKVRSVSSANAHLDQPLGKPVESYDIVSTNFVAESITHHRSTWKKILRHITNLVKLKGFLVLTAIIGAESYKVGSSTFPATPISSTELSKTIVRLGFRILKVGFVKAEYSKQQGYSGISMILARRI